MTVVTAPWTTRMLTGIPSSFCCWKNAETALAPRDQQQALRGPGPREHSARRSADEGDGHDRDELLQIEDAKNASKACITPAVRLSSCAGITQLIASAGRMKISKTSPQAKNIAFGNSPLGFVQRADVDRVHFHPGEREEVADDQDEARDPGPLRDQMVRVHRRSGRVALGQVDDAQDYEHGAGYQGPSEQAV